MHFVWISNNEFSVLKRTIGNSIKKSIHFRKTIVYHQTKRLFIRIMTIFILYEILYKKSIFASLIWEMVSLDI